jgi:phosphoribosylglycinamide formyltransferase 2
VDRYDNAPGHQVAHRAHVIDMTDGDALMALVKQERPHLIVPEIEALNTQTLAEIEQAGLAQVIPTVRAVQLTMNREGIRLLAAETLGLPTSPYAFARSLSPATPYPAKWPFRLAVTLVGPVAAERARSWLARRWRSG